MTSKHLNRQFKQAIYEALHSNPSDRAIMRAWSRKQRFPVAQWVENLEALQVSAISKYKKHSKQVGYYKASWSARMSPSTMSRSSTQTVVQQAELSNQLYNHPGLVHAMPDVSKQRQSQTMILSNIERGQSPTEESSFHSADGNANQDSNSQRPHHIQRSLSSETNTCREMSQTPPITRRSGNGSPHESTSEACSQNAALSVKDQIRLVSEDAMSHSSLHDQHRSPSNLSLLSVDNIIREDRIFDLQKVNPFFTDSSGNYSQKFERRLRHLNGKNSDDQLCIERYLSKSEKDWFKKYNDLKLGRCAGIIATTTTSISAASSIQGTKESSFNEDTDGSTPTVPGSPVTEDSRSEEELKLPKGYVPPSGLKRLMLYRIGDWPLYSIFLAFVSLHDSTVKRYRSSNSLSQGQIIAVNSYQITLLNGEVGEPAEKLYLISTIYLVFSILWWIVFRSLRSIFVLSAPFLVSTDPPVMALWL